MKVNIYLETDKQCQARVAHPVLLGSGGILIGYCFNRNYQRQIYYSSQIIATRTCYGGTWNSWERIK